MRLPSDVLPSRYALQLEIDPKRSHFDGEVRIDLTAPKGLRTLELHCVDLDTREIEVLDRAGPVEVSSARTDHRLERLVLRLRTGLRSPSAQLRIRYSGPLRDDLRGLYSARSGRRRYATTQLEAADARRFFPCFDEPDKKARFALSVTFPKGLVAVSNSPVVKRERGTRTETWAFAETPPLSTYLIALVIGELESSRMRRAGRRHTPIRIWGVPGSKSQMGFALEAAEASLVRLERYFALPYPYEKLDLIAVPDFEFGAMENAGAVTFRESLLLVDPKTISLPERKRVAEVIAHELAHMWFGDLVTMAWWDDLWLNEAFATWMAYSVVDDWKPEWKLWLDFQQARSQAFNLDSLKNTHPIYTEVRTPDEATENFDRITYEKGASVVRMIERWLGERPFRTGVRSYIQAHRESNARASDLWGALEAASGRPVEHVVKSWISRAGFPVLHVAPSETGIRIRQERYSSDLSRGTPAQEEPWPIPAVLRWRGERGRTHVEPHLIEGREESLELGPGALSFVYANAAESGFYRPLHAEELLDQLERNWTRLASVERMGLIEHQWAGVRAGTAPLRSVLDLLPRLASEEEPEVLRTLYAPLAWIHDQLVPALPAPKQAAFSAQISAVFSPSLRELGLAGRKREADDRRALRAILLQLVGTLTEDPSIEEEVPARVRAYLKDRASVDANLATCLVGLAARSGNKSLYEAYLRAMKAAKTPQERTRFQFALAAFRDRALLARTLELLLTPRIPTQDVVILIGHLISNPEAREMTWSFVQERWEALAPRISTGLASRLVAALPALQTRTHRKEVAAFFRAHPLPAAARALRQALERFDLEARQRKRLLPELRSWLRDLASEASR